MNLQVQYKNECLSIQIKKPGQNCALKNCSMHANFVALDKQILDSTRNRRT